MYVLKNAAKNLLRNKSRNILIGIIMIVMMIAIAVSVIIRTTTDQIITNYKANFGAEVYINQDPEKIQAILNDGQNDAVPAMDIKTEQSFANSDYLKETKYTASIPTKLENMQTVGEENENTLDADVQTESEGNKAGSDFNATLLGYSSNSELKEFKEGTRKIIKGEMPKKDTDVLISENLADLNQLKVGDDITLNTVMEGVSTKLTLHICGIYYDGTKDEDYPYMPAELRKNNEILTSADTVLSYAEKIATASGIDEDFIDYEATYILKNPDDISAFEKEVREKGLPDVYSVSTDKTTYDSIVKPVESVAGIATIFLVLVLIIGSLILVFLSTLAVRERKYEIGVLRAMGMKKKTVARGMIYESLILVAFCLLIGLGAGNAAAEPISKSLVQSQIKETQTENSDLEQKGTVFVDVGKDSGKETETVENPLLHAKVSLTAKATAKIAGFALVLALVSSASGLICILRYEPMKILSERS